MTNPRPVGYTFRPAGQTRRRQAVPTLEERQNEKPEAFSRRIESRTQEMGITHTFANYVEQMEVYLLQMEQRVQRLEARIRELE